MNMNNVYFTSTRPIQPTARRRAYRRSTPAIIRLLEAILCGLDRFLTFLSRPTVRRVVKCAIVVACLIAFLCLISAVEKQALSVLTSIVLSMFLVFVEILCLR